MTHDDAMRDEAMRVADRGGPAATPSDAVDVLLLAAGLGTRLQPLTAEIPKALLPVCGLPMLDAQLVRLLGLAHPSVGRVVVNLHHLAGQVRSHVNAIAYTLESTRRHAHEPWIGFSDEPEILGTGGAIAKAAAQLRGEAFAVLNADAFFPAPIEEALAFHRSRDFVSTMVVTPAPFWPNVAVKGDLVVDILPAPRQDAYTFTGLHIVSRSLIELLPARGFHDIRETYRALIKHGKLGAFPWPVRREQQAQRPAPAFLDIGTPENYLEAHRLCAHSDNPLLAVQSTARRMGLIRSNAWHPHLPRPYLYGYIDPLARVGEKVSITESVVFERAEIAPQTSLRRCIIGPGARVSGNLHNLLITVKGRREIRE